MALVTMGLVIMPLVTAINTSKTWVEKKGN